MIRNLLITSVFSILPTLSVQANEDNRLLMSVQNMGQALNIKERDPKIVLQRILRLPEKQATAFWPLYDEYYNKKKQLTDKSNLLQSHQLESSSKNSNVFSLQVLTSLFEIESQSLRIRQEYYKQFALMLEPDDLLRLYQQENRLDNERALRLQTLMPANQKSLLP
ncbi:hypothetical protein [Oceanospirillum sediminis]|uniref:Uncharacterized protein n=1 Tax=Oceanospirillum sediminis TaxID=2760088 RepID=A0A839ISN7_9GAMM|nr:hypothetical protein [Oceanospirillum sediminis]MBB1488473.1 hypothetical protein [Oceanospirillum sediminis]